MGRYKRHRSRTNRRARREISYGEAKAGEEAEERETEEEGRKGQRQESAATSSKEQPI
jgi:hypothetical protein